jgi:hypothetical protein
MSGSRPRTLYAQEGPKVAKVYRDAAALMELEGYAGVAATYQAITKAAALRYRSHVGRVLPAMAFSDFFGEWINDDEGILMVCFAACIAETGDMT